MEFKRLRRADILHGEALDMVNAFWAHLKTSPDSKTLREQKHILEDSLTLLLLSTHFDSRVVLLVFFKFFKLGTNAYREAQFNEAMGQDWVDRIKANLNIPNSQQPDEE